MELAAGCARVGNKILNIVVAFLIFCMLFFGGYSLWYNWSVNHEAFLSDDLMKYKPEPTDTGENPSLYDLMAINPDVVAWLTVDDTNIDYPVVQGETDMEYINKNVYGEFALSGSIFLSCLNSSDFSDSYNLVYGHHMSNGAMFGDVENFLEEEYFEEHTTGTLYLPDVTYQLTFFACLETNTNDSMVYEIQSESDNTARIAYLAAEASRYRAIQISGQDKIIALSTCADAESNDRIVLFGKME